MLYVFGITTTPYLTYTHTHAHTRTHTHTHTHTHRPVVMIALCSLFGLAADVQDSDKHSHKVKLSICFILYTTSHLFPCFLDRCSRLRLYSISSVHYALVIQKFVQLLLPHCLLSR